MFDLITGRDQHCDRITRRDFVRVGGAGLLGLTLPHLLARDAAAAPPRKARNVLMLWMQGGPPQHETFDPKPDAPRELRGDWKAIPTNLPGVQFSEHVPKLAKLADRLTLLRTVYHDVNNHNPAGYYCMAGVRSAQDIPATAAAPTDFPTFQAVNAMLHPSHSSLPSWVWLPNYTGDGPYHTPGQTAGFLGAQYDPLHITADPNAKGFTVPAVTPATDLADRLGRRRSLLHRVDELHAATDRFASTAGLGRVYDRAFDLVTSSAAKEAFDLTRETTAMRERYGRTTFGQSCLLARRLVEAGVRCVTVTHGTGIGNWDTHKQHVQLAPERLALMDHVYSTLLTDMQERGLLEDTLVVWAGEFGRTPRINADAGRDHWPQCYTVALAGAGVKPGFVYGQSDETGAFPESNGVHAHSFQATVYEALGISHNTEVRDALDRPMPVAHGAEPVWAVLK